MLKFFDIHYPLTTAAFSILVVLLLSVRGLGETASAPSFVRDVQPILAQHCFKCHGPDDKSRQASLRLDSREAALKGGESGDPAIVPKKPDESTLIARLLSHDDDFVMPPPSEKKQLKPSQIDTLKRWIVSARAFLA